MKRVLARWIGRLTWWRAVEPPHLAIVRSLELDQPVAELARLHAQLVAAARASSRSAAHRAETDEAIRRLQLAIVKRVERDGFVELRS
jgi:hypothetical protein